jgi:hypothetical protein
VAIEIGRIVLKQRQDNYLTDHYLATHSTAVNIALGVAGISAASLLVPSAELRAYQSLFWLLWLISLLVTATAYAAAITGAIVLPLRLPAVVDLMLPLLLSMSEFLLFGVLASQVTGFSSARAILAGWWLTLAVYSVVALLQVWRAHYLITQTTYSVELQPIIDRYLKRQRVDMALLAGAILFSLGGAVYHLMFDTARWQFFAGQPPTSVSLLLAIPIALVTGSALIGVGRTASDLRTGLAGVGASDA